jgi:hypothetical protein
MRRTKLYLAGMAACALATIGCSKQSAGPDAPVGDSGMADAPDVPGNGGPVRVGASVLTYYKLDQAQGTRSITTSPMAVQPTGSTIVVSVARGDNTQFALPTDNKGNTPYQQLGTAQPYKQWPRSGTAVYAFPSARGGSDFTITTQRIEDRENKWDEITVTVVEVIGGTRIQDFSWFEDTTPQGVPNMAGWGSVTSASVTTTGPATLVAYWWGDGFPGTPQAIQAPDGFTVLEHNVEETDSFIQCAVAVKNVTEAGTYDITWISNPSQGAQLWLVAVQ